MEVRPDAAGAAPPHHLPSYTGYGLPPPPPPPASRTAVRGSPFPPPPPPPPPSSHRPSPQAAMVPRGHSPMDGRGDYDPHRARYPPPVIPPGPTNERRRDYDGGPGQYVGK
jgi:hypothetical protein